MKNKKCKGKSVFLIKIIPIIAVFFCVIIFTSYAQTEQKTEDMTREEKQARYNELLKQKQENEKKIAATSDNTAHEPTMVNARQQHKYYTGDGGKGIRLAVLEPQGKGLSENEQWMLSLVQGSITGDFNKFSAMTIIDRQNLEKIFAEWKEGFSGRYSEENRIKIGNLTNASHILTGSISKTATTFMLELTITDVASGERKASYAPTPVSPIALENLSAVKEASADLLKQLGVNLTSAGLGELKRIANTARIQAETALARGIFAQRQGTEVAALSYFFQAAALDSSLFEASNRSKVMAANISSGNIGANARNDIIWRKSWVARLTETEQTFNTIINTADPPYSLFYSTGIEMGNINYQTETASLSIPINLSANVSWFNAMNRSLKAANAVLDGLNTTKRKDNWGLSNWPWSGVSNANPFSSSKRYDITVVFELVNEQGRAIGNQTVKLNPSYSINRNFTIGYNENISNTVNFNAVKADDISDNLTIRIASVNGEPPQNARFAITAVSKDQHQKSAILQIENGVVLGFDKSLSSQQRVKYRTLVIPSEAWGKPVTAIGDRAFANEQLKNVTIPNTVTTIGNEAFANNQLIYITLPNSVTSIGDKAFSGNPRLEAPKIPNSNAILDTRDGKKYSTVRIGNQTWMAENLNYKTGNSWCYKSLNTFVNAILTPCYAGALYDWNTAMNACPIGWHLPTRQEWDNLINTAGGQKVAGEKLKSRDHQGTDYYGFSAGLSGYRISDYAAYSPGSFYDSNQKGVWWSATEYLYGPKENNVFPLAYRVVMKYKYSNVSIDNNGKSDGYSVRCVQN